MSDKSLASEMVQSMKDVFAELGRRPSKKEFVTLSRYNFHQIDTVFGSYTEFILCCGRMTKAKKIDKQEIRRKTFEHLKSEIEIKKSATIPPPVIDDLLVFPDLHAPFQHIDAIPFIIAVADKYGIKHVLSTGDEIDAQSMNMHDHDPDLFSPGHELNAAIEALKPLYKRFPNMWILDSNHGSMVYRRAKIGGLPRRVLKSYGDILEAPKGWTWHFELVLQFSNGEKCLFHHAYSSDVLAASKKKGVSCFFGHHHTKMGVQYWHNGERLMFAAFGGCLVDDASMALAYNKSQVDRPVLGVTRIKAGIPFTIPMLLDKHRRWNGFVP